MSSVFDFCGTWVEKRDGDSLEPLMRLMKVRDTKIQESLNAVATQRIWIKGTTLVTAYSSQFGEVASTFALNGGWQVSAKKANTKQMISRCSYDTIKRILVIEKRLVRQGGILRDERRLERDSANNILIKQKLEFIPVNESVEKAPSITYPQATVTANRIWERSTQTPIDKTLDLLRGVWVIDEEASESLRPIFEAMQLPAGSIRGALRLRTQHTICLSGPRELLFINQSIHGDMKSVTHPVRELRPGEQIIFPEKGKMGCYASQNMSITLLSTSEDGSSSNRDERTVADNGMFFTQRISFCPVGGEVVVVNRRWKRAPIQSVLWIDTIPLASATNAATGSKGAEPVAPSQVVRSGGAKPSPQVAQSIPTSTSLKVDVDTISASKATDASSGLSNNKYAVLVVLLLVATVARFFLDEMIVAGVFIPSYLVVRHQAKYESHFGGELITPWVQTSILFLVATLALLLPSKGRGVFGDDPEDSLVLLAALCVWGLSRFYAPSRTTYLVTVSDQWLLFAVSLLASSCVLILGLPKLIHGNDEDEPGLGPLTIFVLLCTVWIRAYAWSGPPPPREAQDAAGQNQKIAFCVSVEEFRISDAGSHGEYRVAVKMPDGTEYSSWQRYSSFRTFRHEIGRKDMPFPSKRMFGNTSDEVLAERKEALDVFIKQLFAENGNEKFLETSHEARMFVGAPPQ